MVSGDDQAVLAPDDPGRGVTAASIDRDHSGAGVLDRVRQLVRDGR
jgi:hypothetical protein